MGKSAAILESRLVVGSAQLRDALSAMEPQLGLLAGVISNLEALTTTADHIDPHALVPLAHVARDALESLTEQWRQAFASAQTSDGTGTSITTT